MSVAAKVVTIIAAFEAESAVQKKLAELHVRGYSVTTVQGRGRHGQAPSGILEAKNLSFTVVTSAAKAAELLAWIDQELVPTYPCIAYAADVMAVPADVVH